MEEIISVQITVFNSHEIKGPVGLAQYPYFASYLLLIYRVSKFGWYYTFSGGNFPISTVFVTLYLCQMLAKHINLSTTHSLDLKETTNYYIRIKNQIHALSTVPYVSHLPLIVKCATAHALCI